MTTACIRTAVVSDANVLSALATEVWLDTYAKEGVSATYAAYLARHYSPAAFRKSVEAVDKHTIVCTRGPFMLGYAKLVFGQSLCAPQFGPIELATLYVRRHHKRQGIGQMLLRHALWSASQRGHSSLYLTANHENHDAIRFYEAQGFRTAGCWAFMFDGNEVPNVVMKIPLELTGSAPSA
jgi:ribosomal protein S18 acetylase RimI-like enzyme